ncbi:hypothetical protein N8I77_009125 [Diaporthe amygdali]|uniref:Uncharacterized protein n=1 Tax=Phomopsis amygdali TaxID=1214568 RepID=A0AAD9SAH2_PHOAM|nr:hypothetical protein N8I77_009125 [Diaporthe amygdali]
MAYLSTPSPAAPKTARAAANGSFRFNPAFNCVVMLPTEYPKADSFFAHSGFVNAPNKVPEHQRAYQAAYRAHTRVWRITGRKARSRDGHGIALSSKERSLSTVFSQNPRSTVMYVPFVWIMWGTSGAMMYAMGRKVLGHNTWFGKD